MQRQLSMASCFFSVLLLLVASTAALKCSACDNGGACGMCLNLVDASECPGGYDRGSTGERLANDWCVPASHARLVVTLSPHPLIAADRVSTAWPSSLGRCAKQMASVAPPTFHIISKCLAVHVPV